MDRLLRYWLLGAAVALSAGCGGGTQPADSVELEASPLPAAGLTGQSVAVFPLTQLSTDFELGWDGEVGSHQEALHRADSLIERALRERSPEVDWVFPERLRRAAGRAPGFLPDPDRMATSLLRDPGLRILPDPLRSEMRQLTGLTGGRYALVPAGLAFRPGPEGQGEALLTVVLADVRTGAIGWRSRAKGTGEGPWVALWIALGTLAPEIP